jgi:hypothetical protein
MLHRLGAILVMAIAAAACGQAATPPPKPQPTPTAAPTPTLVPTLTPPPWPTLEPAPNLPPAPDGYRWIYNVSYDERWALAIPSSWVYPFADSEGPADVGLAALEARYPRLTDIILARVNDGRGHGLGFFDPAGTEAGKFMYGDVSLEAGAPPVDLTRAAKDRAEGIAGQEGLAKSAVHYKVVTLPGGPAWIVDWTFKGGAPSKAIGGLPGPRGVMIHAIQYNVFGGNYAVSLTMDTTTSAWTTYAPIFAEMASTLRAI